MTWRELSISPYHELVASLGGVAGLHGHAALPAGRHGLAALGEADVPVLAPLGAPAIRA